MLNDLKRAVCKANRELFRNGLVTFDWGSVSAFDVSMGLFVMKPMGVPYDDLQPELMVVMSMDGQKVEGRLEAEADAEFHRAIYASWAMNIGAIAHSHSLYATSFAQAGRPIPSMGTIHSRCFGTDIPLAEPPAVETLPEGRSHDYRKGDSVVRTVGAADNVSAALIRGHGPVTWGANCTEAVQNAVYLEFVAKLAYTTETLGWPKA